MAFSASATSTEQHLSAKPHTSGTAAEWLGVAVSTSCGVCMNHGCLPVVQGEAKLEMLRKMKEFKRGIHQLGWENKKCEMEVRDWWHSWRLAAPIRATA